MSKNDNNNKGAFINVLQRNGWRIFYAVMAVVAFYFIMKLAWFCFENVFENKSHVTIVANYNTLDTAESYKATYDLFDKQFTQLLTILGFLGTLFGVVVPLVAYFLQRQSLKDEREIILADANENIKQTIDNMAQKIDIELTNRTKLIFQDYAVRLTGIYSYLVEISQSEEQVLFCRISAYSIAIQSCYEDAIDQMKLLLKDTANSIKEITPSYKSTIDEILGSTVKVCECNLHNTLSKIDWQVELNFIMDIKDIIDSLEIAMSDNNEKNNTPQVVTKK